TKMATVGTLVAGLSHELNNPLAVILGHAQANLRRLGEQDPLRPPLAAIERQARRCADLVGMLLDFSRKQPAGREVISVETLLSRVIDLSSVKLRRSQVRLEQDLGRGEAPKVCVGRTQIESALLNILDNAIGASSAGATVRIQAGPRRREDRAGIEIAIVDVGKGIEPAVMEHIFDPFFTTKPSGQGTGLGLSLARQFVEAHAGHLSVESQFGSGTTVRLWLPAVSDRAHPASS